MKYSIFELSGCILKQTNMSVAALNFRGLTIIEKVARTKFIVSKTERNNNFVEPSPSLEEITESVNDLESKNSLLNEGSGVNKLKLKIANLFHNKIMADFTSYVQSKSGGDAVKIQSSGLDVKHNSNKSKLLAKVCNVKARPGDFSGEVVAKWKLVKGTKLYISHKSLNGLEGWISTDCTSTKVKMTITGLVSEQPIWLRFAAVNSLGHGEWSEPVRVMAS